LKEVNTCGFPRFPLITIHRKDCYRFLYPIGQTCVYTFRSYLIGLDILLPTDLIELLPIFKSCMILVNI